MVSLVDYERKKATNLASVKKINDTFFISEKQFDSETGEQIDDKETKITIDELDNLRTHFTEEIARIDRLKAEINTL